MEVVIKNRFYLLYEILKVYGDNVITSNIGCLAELGRFPIIYNIICAVCNYYSRLHIFKEGDLLYHTLKSQQTRKHNSGVSFTYDKFTNTLLNELNINHNMLLTQKDSNDNTYKIYSLKYISKYRLSDHNLPIERGS